MWRLHTQSDKFDGLRLENCGLIFLSTPHCGTTQADRNKLFTDLAELALGFRSREILDELRSFNLSSVDHTENFAALQPKPPFHCFCEGEKTKIASRDREVSLPNAHSLCSTENSKVVTQSSAGFSGQVAEKILKTDHHTICKFETQFDGYMPLLSRLKSIRALLLKRAAGENNEPSITRLVCPWLHLPRHSSRSLKLMLRADHIS